MSKMGRPTTCTEEIQRKAWEYVYGGWEAEGHAFPSVVGLCDVLNTAKSTIYKWEKNPEFDFVDILAAINAKQELVAFDKGIRNEYNANLVKLLLGKHGYSEKQEIQQRTELSVHGISDEELEDIVNSED